MGDISKYIITWILFVCARAMYPSPQGVEEKKVERTTEFDGVYLEVFLNNICTGLANKWVCN